jgi:hypothetical protein
MSSTRSSKRKAASVSSSDGSNEDPQPSSPSALIDAAVAEELANKRLREQTASFSEEFICSITHELMVDPVLAQDGNTYERSAILEWLETNNKSPLNPSQILDPDRLLSNRAVLLCIEKLVLSSTVNEGLCKEWRARKKKFDLEKAQQLFDEGKVLEAAKLGLPEAQGKMAGNYFLGEDGFEKDLDKCFEFAKQAAEERDERGQFLLGYAYINGEGAEKDFVAALKWFGLTAEQGSLASMYYIGYIYRAGGFGVPQDFDAAFTWFKKSADGGDEDAQYEVATMYYKGLGVTKDLTMARSWFKKSSDLGKDQAQGRLGMMMATGEGGGREFAQGLALVEAAAEKGDSDSTKLMQKHYASVEASWHESNWN